MKKNKKNGEKSKQGEGGGKPPIYKNEDELKKVVGNYFKRLDELPPLTREMPSKVGLRTELCLIRDTYNEYKKRYPDTIKKAENIIEKAWVERLAGANATGSIFYLKNAFFEDYRDRTEHDLLSGGKVLKITGMIIKKE